MMVRIFKNISVLILLAAVLCFAGCSSSSSNIITVTVSPSSTVVLAGQVQSFTATVGGSTTLTVQWTCSYSYTPAPTTAVPAPKPVTGTCTSGGTINGGTFGTWTTTASPPVLIYTAPALSSFPNPAPILTFTAAADADHNKKGTAAIALDSGIRVSITPNTATVQVGTNQHVQFHASLLNAPPIGLTWLLTQPNTASTTIANQTANPLSATCSPNCGMIDSNGVYTSPTTLPTDTTPAGSKSTTPTNVYVVVNSSSDTSHFAIGGITLVSSTTNPISFSGITPTVVPAGAVLQDIFLDAHNLLNTSTITFTPPGQNAAVQPIDPATQIFTIPISPSYCTPSATGVTPVVTCDASIVTRVRLNQQNLAAPENDPNFPAMITVNNIPDPPPPSKPLTTGPGCTIKSSGGVASISCVIHLVYASPALVAAVPDSIPVGSDTAFAVDGGYFGSCNNPIAKLLFNGSFTAETCPAGSSSRQFVGSLQSSQIQSPGLYPVSVESNAIIGTPPPTPPFPPQFPIATTNIAIQPIFSHLASVYNPTNPPANFVQPVPPSISLGTGNAAPSSIALNSARGYAVITDQGNNSIQIIDLTGSAPTIGPPITMGIGIAPTNVAIDSQISLSGQNAGQDLGVVVNSGDPSLSLIALPSGNLVGKIDLTGLIPEQSGNSVPTPYSVGVDPGTHLGVVAYTSSNVGFIVDVNPADTSPSQPCYANAVSHTPPCVVAPVSLNTGFTPQVVMQPQAPFAYVTPGGGGVTSVVNLLQSTTSVNIAPTPNGAVRTNNIVTIITSTPHGINPALGGTVIIQGLDKTDLNGTYQINPGSVIDPFTFSYTQAGTLANESGGSPTTGNPATVQYGSPYYTFNTTNTAVGAAINPITRTFAFADYNSTSQQIGFIGTLDFNVSSLTLTVGSCGGGSNTVICHPMPAGAPESGFRWVSFDPFTNVLVAYNPSVNSGATFAGNSISLINPGGNVSGGVSQPYRIIAAIPTGQVGTGSYTPAGSTTPVTVNGPMIYDPKSHLVLVANAGSNTLSYLNLDADSAQPFKKTHILATRVVTGGVANAQPALGSLGAGQFAQCNPTTGKNQLASCMPQAIQAGQAATIQILGQGFNAGSLVRLDTVPSVPCPNTTTFCSAYASASKGTEIDLTIPAGLLKVPHDYGLDVITDGVTTNSVDLFNVAILNLATTAPPVCVPSPTLSATTLPQGPEAIAIDNIRRVAIITNYACGNATVINLDIDGKTYGGVYGAVLATVPVGTKPLGVGVIPRLGYAVVANNGDNTATIIDMSNPTAPKVVPITTTSGTTTTTTQSVAVGVAPIGVTIDQDRALALIANSGSNTVSSIDLTVLFPSDPSGNGHKMSTPTASTVAVSGPPDAISVDPNRAIAVVTNLQNAGTTGSTGGLDVLNLAVTPPLRSTTNSVSGLTASPTGIAYDPAVTPALFYVTSTQQNAVYSFNPDTSGTSQARVGVNPFSIAYNYQTGTMLTINSTSNTSSVLDTQTFTTRETLGISSQSQFAAAMDNFTNTAIVVDQNNNRVIFLPMPK
jgi:DNA-binding beta-propeller fold protein YncE